MLQKLKYLLSSSLSADSSWKKKKKETCEIDLRLRPQPLVSPIKISLIYKYKINQRDDWRGGLTSSAPSRSGRSSSPPMLFIICNIRLAIKATSFKCQRVEDRLIFFPFFLMRLDLRHALISQNSFVFFVFLKADRLHLFQPFIWKYTWFYIVLDSTRVPLHNLYSKWSFILKNTTKTMGSGRVQGYFSQLLGVRLRRVPMRAGDTAD